MGADENLFPITKLCFTTDGYMDALARLAEDDRLLLKILETHELSVDAKRVATARPGDDSNAKPTARAITERLVKMRQLAKSNGAGHFSTIGGKTVSTPRKLHTRHRHRPNPASGKRKHGPIADNGMLKPGPETINVDSDDDGTENKDSLKAKTNTQRENPNPSLPPRPLVTLIS
ncbi:hypothetical protein V8E54_012928 [Elaphomyces granulatus]